MSNTTLISMKSSLASELSTSDRFRLAGWLAWLTLAMTITFTVLMLEERSVTPSYRSAVFNWFAGAPLYNLQGHGFLYLPQAALTFAPWAIMPHDVGEVTWRLFMIGVLAASVARLTRLLNGDGKWFFVISVCSSVMAWGCARNGQSSLLLIGMMIFAVADLYEGYWWRAAILLSVAFAVKPLVFVLILLAGALYPKVSWRLVVCLAIVAIIPFATQQTGYVVSQYMDCIDNLRVTFRVGENENWAQLFGMLNVAGIPISQPVRNVIRIIAAGMTLYLCLLALRKISPQKSAFYVLAFAACYLMLFNSRTEGNTYAVVGPVYGVLLAEAAIQLKNKTRMWCMIAAVVFSVLNYDLAILVTSRSNAIWISPLVCVAVTIYLVRRLYEELPA